MASAPDRPETSPAKACGSSSFSVPVVPVKATDCALGPLISTTAPFAIVTGEMSAMSTASAPASPEIDPGEYGASFRFRVPVVPVNVTACVLLPSISTVAPIAIVTGESGAGRGARPPWPMRGSQSAAPNSWTHSNEPKRARPCRNRSILLARRHSRRKTSFGLEEADQDHRAPRSTNFSRCTTPGLQSDIFFALQDGK